jgi:hypothetical protein
MVGIGLNFAAEGDAEADIEATLVDASARGMEEQDLRVLAVLTTWLGTHHAHVNADRLVRFVKAQASPRVRAYWSSIATWLRPDRRFARLRTLYRGAALEILPTGTSFQVARRGEDERFVGTKLRVPSGTLRDRPDDVLPPELLVRKHMGYRNRVIMGPSWRADVWTVREKAPDVSIAEVARRASCSFATAWQAAQDFRLLASARAASPRAHGRRDGGDGDSVRGAYRWSFRPRAACTSRR